jgi:hypothetical protein
MSSIDQNESIELSADELEEHGSESNDEGGKIFLCQIF